MMLCEQSECTGCTACFSACPSNAIEMIEKDGFKYPVINKQECINCGACEKVCNLLKEVKNNLKYPNRGYAVKLKDDEMRMKSQSGGLFYALACAMLSINGIVYGCGYDEDMEVVHMRIDSADNLYKLRGSKYVQSDLGDSYNRVKEDLKNGLSVLFSGTPCQIYGLNAFLKTIKCNMENLYTFDFVCHGVPSPGLYKKYKKFIEEKNNSKISSLNFRAKEILGWREHVEKIVFENGSEYHGKIYTNLFYSEFGQRKSCENCNYTSKKRCADISGGDFWGIENINKDIWNDDKGISMCLIQSEKGKYLFGIAEKCIDVFEVDVEKINQPPLCYPATVPKKKNCFWKDYSRLSFEKLLKKYTEFGGIKFKLKRKIYRFFDMW